MEKLTKFINAVARYVSYLSMAALVVIMVLMTIDVFLRLVFNKPILGGYEVVTMIMTIVVFGSWAYTQTEHGHIHVTILLKALPTKVRFAFFFLTSLLSVVTMGFLAYAGLRQAIKVYGTKNATSVLLIPHWPFLAIECIAVALFTLVLLLDAIKALLAMFNSDYAEEVMSYWV